MLPATSYEIARLRAEDLARDATHQRCSRRGLIRSRQGDLLRRLRSSAVTS